MNSRVHNEFLRFHSAYPEVLVELRAVMLGLASRNEGTVSIKRGYEALRVNRELDNSFTSRYARLLLATTPELRDRIETRRLRAQ